MAVEILKIICMTIVALAIVFAVLVIALRPRGVEDNHDGKGK